GRSPPCWKNDGRTSEAHSLRVRRSCSIGLRRSRLPRIQAAQRQEAQRGSLPGRDELLTIWKPAAASLNLRLLFRRRAGLTGCRQYVICISQICHFTASRREKWIRVHRPCRLQLSLTSPRPERRLRSPAGGVAP